MTIKLIGYTVNIDRRLANGDTFTGVKAEGVKDGVSFRVLLPMTHEIMNNSGLEKLVMSTIEEMKMESE